MHIHLTDPTGVIPSYDQRVDCEWDWNWDAGPSRPGPSAWDVSISAEAADGTILYQYVEEEVDMSTPQTFTWELQAKTSETHFYPKFAGTGSAGLEYPEGISTARWGLYLNDLTAFRRTHPHR